jgi:RimJ/RimL family protein N-acetyltransferase
MPVCQVGDPASLCLRPLAAPDRESIAAAFAQLGPDSLYWRFGSPAVRADVALAWTAALDRDGSDLALGAFGCDGLVGVARLVADGEGGGDSAEIAVTVVDRCQGHGVGTLLARRLLDEAARHGMAQARAFVLAENLRAVRLTRRLGGRRVPGHSGVLVEYVLPVTTPGG